MGSAAWEHHSLLPSPWRQEREAVPRVWDIEAMACLYGASNRTGFWPSWLQTRARWCVLHLSFSICGTLTAGRWCACLSHVGPAVDEGYWEATAVAVKMTPQPVKTCASLLVTLVPALHAFLSPSFLSSLLAGVKLGAFLLVWRASPAQLWAFFAVGTRLWALGRETNRGESEWCWVFSANWSSAQYILLECIEWACQGGSEDTCEDPQRCGHYGEIQKDRMNSHSPGYAAFLLASAWQQCFRSSAAQVGRPLRHAGFPRLSARDQQGLFPG